jgi:release factor glutamine methyltransferase
VIDGAPPRLVAGGAIAVEHGYAQSGAVQDLLREAGFVEITAWRDLAGTPRVAAGRLR